MKNDMTTENAKIESTMLGYEDHGILTFWLFLNFDGSSQGFGGYALDTPLKDSSGKFIERIPTKATGLIMKRILDTVGVGSWEKLKGEYIRVEREGHGCGTKIVRIGHLLKDKWFSIDEISQMSE